MPKFGRMHKATALVPLAVLSTAWTATFVGAGGSTAASEADPSSLPDGTSVPTQAIEAPASVSLPDAVAPSVPRGQSAQVIATASTSGIPSGALAAYQRAEAIINSADKTCNISWQLIAAIGRVESDHGRFGGNVLDGDGVASPGIYGIALNGKNKTQVITDTDAGQYDNDIKYDRAVGPMQFIPSTWSVVGVDGDNDGTRNPQDIDDSALATAVYLCSGDDDLSTEAGQRASVYRYNHSHSYVDLVLSVMQAYLDGDFVSVSSRTTSAGVFLPDPTRPTSSSARGGSGGKETGGKKKSTATAVGTKDEDPSTQVTTTVKPTPTTTATPKPTPTPTQTQDPLKQATDDVKETVKSPLPDPIKTPVDQVLTYAEAQAFCLASGISALDLNALNTCINDQMTP
ncbi:lytic transglycosylase domain-containing protein [Nocardioides gansuensis]|uniref:lytic transglycosylase domain-containing protein n=1 Tax=Nocardioides gansuensis TaxID=2138300 RepID=UPI000E2FFB9D|nr:lytic murein transglycosylase [Nocardioides gansuensis]